MRRVEGMSTEEWLRCDVMNSGRWFSDKNDGDNVEENGDFFGNSGSSHWEGTRNTG